MCRYLRVSKLHVRHFEWGMQTVQYRVHEHRVGDRGIKREISDLYTDYHGRSYDHSGSNDHYGSSVVASTRLGGM